MKPFEGVLRAAWGQRAALGPLLRRVGAAALGPFLRRVGAAALGPFLRRVGAAALGPFLRRVGAAARRLSVGEGGAALAEMVVAMFLLGLTVPGVMGFLSTTTRAIGAAAHRQEALEEAVAQMEVIAYAPYDRTLDGVLCPSEVAAYGGVVGAGDYEIEIEACTQEKGSQRVTVRVRVAGGTMAAFEVYKADR